MLRALPYAAYVVCCIDVHGGCLVAFLSAYMIMEIILVTFYRTSPFCAKNSRLNMCKTCHILLFVYPPLNTKK